MKKVGRKIRRFIVRQLIIFMLVMSALITPLSTYVGTTTTVYASSYNSWISSWETGTTYDGINSLLEEETPESEGGVLDWLGETIEAVLAILTKNSVGSLLLLLVDSMGLSLEKIVYGPILGSKTTNAGWFQFSLKDGNIWGLSSSILYAVLRNFIFAMFAIQFIHILASYLLKQSAGQKVNLKDLIYNYFFVFGMLYAVPIIVDITLFVRDSLLRGFVELTNKISSSYALGITDLILEKTADDYTLPGAIILCFTLGSSFIFLFDYSKRALQQVYLFGVFPVVAFRSFSDKSILNKWASHFFTSLFIPVLDSIGLWIVVLIQSYNGGLPNSKGPAMLGLLVYMSIIPCRNMIAQLFGMPIGDRGFGGLMTAAMMMMRGLGNKIRSGKDKIGGDAKNQRPEIGAGDNNTIGGPAAEGAVKGFGATEPAGNGIGMSGPNGGDAAFANTDTSYDYDGNGNLASSTETVTSAYGNDIATTTTTYGDDGNAAASYTEFADGSSLGSNYSYDEGSLSSVTTDNYGSDGLINGTSMTEYDTSGNAIRTTGYDSDGRVISDLSMQRDQDGTIVGATRIDTAYPTNIDEPTLKDGSVSTSRSIFDGNGNRTSEVSDFAKRDGSITHAETSYNPETTKPVSIEQSNYSADGEFASSVTQTNNSQSGTPTSSVRPDYDKQGHIQSQTETAYNDKGHPVSATTTTFDENGNKTGTVVDNNIKSPLQDRVRESARDRINSFKNAFVAPTVSTIDMNGSEKKVHDQEAIKRQIAIAERKLGGYQHKSDGTVDWKREAISTAEHITNGPIGKVARGVAKATVTGAAVSIGAAAGPQSMVIAGYAANAAAGKAMQPSLAASSPGQAAASKPTSDQAANTNTGPQGKIEKPASPKNAPRKKPLSPEAQAKEHMNKKLESE